MAGTPTERLQWKEPLHSLEVELQHDFGLNPVHAKALCARVAQFVDSLVTDSAGFRQPGQISYCAVAASEPAGKPLRHCLTIPVSLSLLHPLDAALQRSPKVTPLVLTKSNPPPRRDAKADLEQGGCRRGMFVSGKA